MKSEITRVKVELEGITPLLMNSPKNMLEPQKGTKKKTEKYDAEVEVAGFLFNYSWTYKQPFPIKIIYNFKKKGE